MHKQKIIIVINFIYVREFLWYRGGVWYYIVSSNRHVRLGLWFHFLENWKWKCRSREFPGNVLINNFIYIFHVLVRFNTVFFEIKYYYQWGIKWWCRTENEAVATHSRYISSSPIFRCKLKEHFSLLKIAAECKFICRSTSSSGYTM